MSEPVKQPEYDPEDLAAIKLAEEQKKAADLAAQTESIYIRNKEVWKTTNRDILEDHCVKEGLNFSKEAIDATHAKYVAELQIADEAKAKADAAEAGRKKIAESASGSDTSTVKPLDSDKTAINVETQRLLDIAPHLTEVITDMWNASTLRQGWEFVVSVIETKHKVALTALSREVYTAYKTSKGSEEALKQLIQQHAPRQIATQDIQNTTPGANKTAIIPVGDQKSSVNQAPQPNIAAGRVPESVPDTSTSPPNTVLDVFERNLKLTAEQVISSLRCEYGTSRV
ncbi:MAG: hypothetical protein ABSD49_08630 [Candidatus Bathyarchaeia archaeon]